MLAGSVCRINIFVLHLFKIMDRAHFYPQGLHVTLVHRALGRRSCGLLKSITRGSLLWYAIGVHEKISLNRPLNP